MYRLNCHLTDELGERLADYSERAGVTKVTAVAMALEQYLNVQETRFKLLEELSDPVKFAEICKIMGVSAPGDNPEVRGSASSLLD